MCDLLRISGIRIVENYSGTFLNLKYTGVLFMSEQEYNDLWHYSEQFTRDPLHL